MKTRDLISMSVRSLWRRKLRTCLTILGVVIGATSIILMLSLGLAMEQNMEEQFASWGDLTLIDVYGYGGGENSPDLDDEAVSEISKIENVVRVIPMLQADAYVTIGKYRTMWSEQVYALDAADIEALGYVPEEGRNVLEGETHAALMGKGVLNYFFKIGKRVDWDKLDWGNMEKLPFDMTTEKITLEVSDFDDRGKPYLDGSEGKIKAPKGIQLDVVGLMSEEDWNVAEAVLVSREVFDELVEKRQKYQKALGYGQDDEEKKKMTYDQVRVKVNDRNNVVAAAEAIEALGYGNVDANMTYLEQAQKQAEGKRLALGGIGIVSFFVAAIGIANTMMMSIYERTKEIGVMKVIGARLEDIKRMFLFEALMIGLIGGIVGSLISYLLSLGMNAIGEPIARIMDMQDCSVVSIVPLWLILGAIAFSTLIGLISGYFPARKAMKLSALTAIKTE